MQNAAANINKNKKVLATKQSPNKKNHSLLTS